MQLQYAAEKLDAHPAGTFSRAESDRLPAIKIELKKDPAAAMRNILESLGGQATRPRSAR